MSKTDNFCPIIEYLLCYLFDMKRRTKAKIVKAREKLIITSLKDERVSDIFSDVLFYYRLYDALHGTNRAELLTALYLNRHRRGVVEMTIDYYISDRTLARYREEFVNCFYEAMQLNGSIEEIAAAWDD